MTAIEPKLFTVQCASPAGLHRMAYYQWGRSDNPRVLVCVHGLTRNGRDFDVFARSMAQHYRVICPDVVGRGQSDWLRNPAYYGVPQYVMDMVVLLARLNVEQVDWFGTSMGGLIGMSLAAWERAPVRRLLLNDVGPRLDAAALARIGSYVGQDCRFASFDEGLAYLQQLTLPFGPHTAEQWRALNGTMLRRSEDGMTWRLHYDPAIAFAFRAITPELAAAGEAALWQAFERITAETLVVRGAKSDLLSGQTVEEMCRRGMRVQSMEVAGVGHAPSFIAPEQIVRAQTFFLSE